MYRNLSYQHAEVALNLPHVMMTLSEDVQYLLTAVLKDKQQIT
jgi:hypothetical protein